ncbi:MAG: sulfatase-like hydrolase/transferase [Luteitalea sp.]|nr:sulfatase-like hydrolase/transferase [Luteitalea sp.]
MSRALLRIAAPTLALLCLLATSPGSESLSARLAGELARKGAAPTGQDTPSLQLLRLPNAQPRNIVFILVDDLRYDVFGFTGHRFIETPHLDALARGGVHFSNAVVTTSLCSPSRASILTGLYAHGHRIINNNEPVPPDLRFFSQYLQTAGYETAFVGKWHMGHETDDPQRGFDHWVSFSGQGVYLPSPKTVLNVNGRHVPQQGYITDELTDYALDWLRERDAEQPFMLYLSHKAVHGDFAPAKRHQGRYATQQVDWPRSFDPSMDPKGRPMWVRNQRNSWHGVDFAYHSGSDLRDVYRRYLEAVLAVDDSVGLVVELLRQQGLLESTVVMLMGDNGFAWGEHGLIDKRTAYEESMRVPLVAYAPGFFPEGRTVEEVVANIDVAPTVLETAGLQPPSHMDGRSFLDVARGKQVSWRDAVLYEYFWERNFPQTPTMHALRGQRYKYIHYHGIWDLDELYDLQADPDETTNLINDPAHNKIVQQMNQQLFDVLEQTDGMQMPLYRDRGGQNNLRRKDGPKAAKFPEVFKSDPKPPQ